MRAALGEFPSLSFGPMIPPSSVSFICVVSIVLVLHPFLLTCTCVAGPYGLYGNPCTGIGERGALRKSHEPSTFCTSTRQVLLHRAPPGECSSLVKALQHPPLSTPPSSGSYQAP
jgi:hypothetical protein